jgi:hypothetical protein
MVRLRRFGVETTQQNSMGKWKSVTIISCHLSPPPQHTRTTHECASVRGPLATYSHILTDCGIHQKTPTARQKNQRNTCIHSRQSLLIFSKTFPPWKLFTRSIKWECAIAYLFVISIILCRNFSKYECIVNPVPSSASDLWLVFLNFINKSAFCYKTFP